MFNVDAALNICLNWDFRAGLSDRYNSTEDGSPLRLDRSDQDDQRSRKCRRVDCMLAIMIRVSNKANQKTRDRHRCHASRDLFGLGFL